MRCAWAIALLSACSLWVVGAADRNFTIENDRFVKDGEVVQLISGSVHYHRILPEYWQDRLERVKAMGINTIELYVPWNYHERFPGQYTWDGMADVVRFIELIRDLDMMVLLRVGPYICAEWDFGGFPWWLGSSMIEGGGTMKLRSSDPAYLKHVDRWFNALLPRLSSLLYLRGGPVVMVQLENEYGFIGDENDKTYMRHLLSVAKAALGEDTIYYTTDPPPNVAKGSLPGDEIFTVVDFGPGWYNLDDAFGRQAAYNAPGKSPALCAEFYPGWLVHWGEKMANTSADVLTASFKDILAYNNGTGSVNFYMAHGGTNFAWTAGAGIALYGSHKGLGPKTLAAGNSYQPHITSYDYDCMVSEAGDYGQPGIGGPNKYEMVRNAVKHHLGQELPSPPKPPHVAPYGDVQMSQAMSLAEALEGLWPGEGIVSKRPLHMEEYGQGGGLILYRTQLPAGAVRNGGLLDVSAPVHDYAKVLVDGKVVGDLDRNKGTNLMLPAIDGSAVLDILVQGVGRDNAGAAFDTKGLQSEEVRLDGKVLEGWHVFPLPLDTHKDWPNLQHGFGQLPGCGAEALDTPAFYRATFKADPKLRGTNGHLPDTFLSTPGWHKGVAFINGFNLGWYWPAVGPQMTLYVPGPLLKDGENELILLEVDGAPEDVTVSLTGQPDFYGPAGQGQLQGTAADSEQRSNRFSAVDSHLLRPASH